MHTSDSADRRLIARLAAHSSCAQTAVQTARTAPARAALLLRFEDQGDPNRQLVPGERRKRAENARKAYYTALALKSAQSRRRAPSTRGAVERNEVEVTGVAESGPSPHIGGMG